MKTRVLFGVILILSSSVSLVSAATPLGPSLTTQMLRQEQVNKKNDLSARLREQERLRQAAKERVQALKNKKNTPNNTGSIIPVINPIQGKTPLSIKHPPEISPIQPTIGRLSDIQSPSNINMNIVRATWLDWYNSVRKSEKLNPLSYDIRLHSTAYDWNIELAKGYWKNHHTRNPWDGYYNFTVIDKWFMERWINPKVINRTKHTENVWYGSYSCRSSDCTSSLISSIRSTFDFFMSEKWKSYNPHYRSIIQPYFSKIWLSVIIVPSEQRYYLVVHYITE